MRMKRVFLASAVALLCALAAAPTAGAAVRRVPQGFFGATWDGAVAGASARVRDEQWALMSRTGVESVRAVFSWAEAQPDAAASPDFSRSDRIVSLATRHRMSVLPVVVDTPDWAAAFKNAASPPRDPADYGDFLQALEVRYGPGGSFWSEHPRLPERPIRAYQVWNEPELPYRWYAKRGSKYAWPRGYVTLLREARRALRPFDPGAKIVLAGLADDSWNSLRRLYRRHARRYFDVAGIQTYTGSPKHVLKAIRLFRRVMRRYGDARKPIWATETGWPAAVGRMHVPRRIRTLVTTDRGMAIDLKLLFRYLATRRRLAPYRVGRIYWYTWSSPYRSTGDIFAFAGLLSYYRGRFERKPALRAYRTAARRYEGCAKDSFGACRR
jgi:polysaccharide biosynthesis protein PslG